MSFNYQPISSNGVANAVNGSMAAATNLIKMQHLIDMSREERQEKLHQKMLMKQKRESNFSTRTLLMESLDDEYYEKVSSLDGDDDNTRAMAMWDRLNSEHGNNKDLGGFLDKYKNTTDFSGDTYSRFKRDMKHSLLNATVNAEEEATGYTFVESVKDPDGGEPRTAKMFDIAKYMAYKEGNSEEPNAEFIKYMKETNKTGRDHLNATGDDYKKNLEQAADMANKALIASKFSRSKAEGGSAGVDASGNAYSVAGSPYYAKPSDNVQYKESTPSLVDSYEKQGVNLDDFLHKRDTKKVYNFQYLASPKNVEVANSKGKTVLYTRLFETLPDDFQQKVKKELGKNLSNEERLNLNVMEDDDFGFKLREFINSDSSDTDVAQKLIVGISDAVLPDDANKSSNDGTGGDIKPGVKATSWSRSGIEDPEIRKNLAIAGSELGGIIQKQIALMNSTAADEKSRQVGSKRLRMLKLLLSPEEFTNEDNLFSEQQINMAKMFME